ncbi:MAG: ABC transporter permease [bacterium]
MLKNYLKIALRNFARQKGNAFVNIIGPAIGMTCSMLILMWVQHELSFDRFNQNADDIYRVVENQYYAGGQIFPVAVTPSPLGPALKEQIPEIIKATRFVFGSLAIKRDDKIFAEGVAFADPDIFEIFTIPFVKGNAATALSEPHSIVLTDDAAEKYFGADEPVGRVLRINHRDDFLVTGVIKNIPDNSHVKYDLLVPFIYQQELGNSMESWGNNWRYTYVLLQKNARRTEVDKKIIDLIKKNNEGSTTEIYLQPLTRIHLYSSGNDTADIGGHGDILYVRIFSAIAFVEKTYKQFDAESPFQFNFLDQDYDMLYRAEQRVGKLSGYAALVAILIASLGLYGLASYVAEQRTKEIGIRKVLGASVPDLFLMLSKNFVMLAGIANLIAWPVAYFMMAGWLQNYAYRTSLNVAIFLLATILAVLIVLVTVSYQAIRVALANPIEALRYE